MSAKPASPCLYQFAFTPITLTHSKEEILMKQFRVLACMFAILGLVLAGCAGGSAPEGDSSDDMAAAAPAEGGEEMAEDAMVEFTQQVMQYNTIADYESATGNQITSFQQSPMLDALVADGSSGSRSSTGGSVPSATNCPTSTGSSVPIWATARLSYWMSSPVRTTT